MPKGKGTPVLDAATGAVLATGRREFDALFARIAPRFARAEVRSRAQQYLGSLFARWRGGMAGNSRSIWAS